MIDYNIILKCLRSMRATFSRSEFSQELKKHLNKDANMSKEMHSILRMLEKEGVIKKIDSDHYKKTPAIIYDPVEHAKDLIKECESKNLVWKLVYNGMAGSADFVVLGISGDNDLSDAQRDLQDFLFDRMASLFAATNSNMKYVEEHPRRDAEYLYQALLEVIPTHLGHEAGTDSDGLPFEDAAKIIKKMIMAVKDMSDVSARKMMDQVARLEEYQRKGGYGAEGEKAKKYFGLIILPRRQLLEEQDGQDSDILEDLQCGFKSETDKQIFKNLTDYKPEAVQRILKKYDGYFPEERMIEIRRLYGEYILGWNAIKCLCEIFVCRHIITRLESKKTKEGDDIRNEINIVYLRNAGESPDEQPAVKSPSYYAEKLARAEKELKELFRQNHPQDLISHGAYSLHLHSALREFQPTVKESLETLSEYGIGNLSEEEFENWITLGVEKSKQFMHDMIVENHAKWLERRDERE